MRNQHSINKKNNISWSRMESNRIEHIWAQKQLKAQKNNLAGAPKSTQLGKRKEMRYQHLIYQKTYLRRSRIEKKTVLNASER
jgi:predicted cupin superfamily sugar epimerase